MQKTKNLETPSVLCGRTGPNRMCVGRASERERERERDRERDGKGKRDLERVRERES